MTEVTALFERDGRGCRAYRVRDRVVSRSPAGRLSPTLSAHLAFVDARRGCRVVLVVPPRRMMEMDDEIAVVRNDRAVEGDPSDAAPIPEGAPLAEERAVRLPVIRDLDVEGERALRPGVAAVVDLRHDLVAEIQSRALDSGLAWRHRETHEGRRARRVSLRLSELRNLVELANVRLFVDHAEHHPDDHQERHAQAPPQRRRVRSVEQFDVVDVVGVVAADILLGHETGGAQRRDVFRLRGREQLAHHRQRAEMAAPRLAATGRIAPHDQRPAAVAEIAGIAGVLRDLPQAGQANAVRMHQAAEAFSIRAPTQVGGGIDRARGGLAKGVGRTARQDAEEQAAQRDRVDRQRRLPGRPPCSLIGIGEQRFAHVGETRTGVGAVFIGDGFYPKRTRSHGGALTSGPSGSPCRWLGQIISDLITAGKPALPRSFTNDEESPFVSSGRHIVWAQSRPGDRQRSRLRISAGMFGGGGNTMKLPRRKILHLAAPAGAPAARWRGGAAQGYPSRPVRLVVGFAAGSTTDILARLIGQWLSERLGQQFVIENRPGAAGNIAAQNVVKAPADRYTPLTGPPASAIKPTLYDKLRL